MEQKNFLLAMALIATFLILWSKFVIPRYAPPPALQSTGTLGATNDKGTLPAATELKSAHAEMGEPVVTTDTILRDAKNEIVLTPRGGAVKNWRLKLSSQEADLVLKPDADVLPLATFPETLFKIEADDHHAVMTATLPDGLHLTKTLTLSPTGHLHELSYRFQNPTGAPIELSKWAWGWGPGLGTAEGEQKENMRLIRVITLGKLKVHVIKPGEPADMGRWAAIDNRYYLVAFVPKDQRSSQVVVDGTKADARLSLIENITIPARGETTVTYALYVGPKGFSQLKKYGDGLEESVDFGTFSGLGRLIFRALNFLKTVTGNYGVAIILLTMGIQILMFPLTIKSFKATMAMKKLQPKIAEIQARYKSDPKRLNVEMMNLYKNTGTNPFGGCLPMLLQMPIFFALFTTLRNAYELRGAPFFGWVHDLSAPDVLVHIGTFPLHALPLIMGGAMFLQQRMAGAATDPTQKQMMTMMPVMFTFMFYGFPAGLVLYWLTNNLMTMGVQWGFQRWNTGGPDRVIETTIVK